MIPSASRERGAHRRKLAREVTREGRRLWRQVDPVDVTGSWRSLSPRLLAALAGAQLAAARGADEYVDAALSAQNITSSPAGEVAARRFAGIASDGRPLESLLDQPRRLALAGIGRGDTVPRAMASGQAELDMILRTQVADAGRVADGVATTARPGVGWVRMLVGESCGRCAILAGRFYRYSSGFARHPRCDCINIPSQEATSSDLTTNPQNYFDSLTDADQSRLFGKANSEAIRDGADMNRVVNATGRGGMYTTVDGRKATRELARGDAPTRPVPEEIYRTAPSRTDAVDALRLHGYLL